MEDECSAYLSSGWRNPLGRGRQLCSGLFNFCAPGEAFHPRAVVAWHLSITPKLLFPCLSRHYPHGRTCGPHRPFVLFREGGLCGALRGGASRCWAASLWRSSARATRRATRRWRISTGGKVHSYSSVGLRPTHSPRVRERECSRFFSRRAFSRSRSSWRLAPAEDEEFRQFRVRERRRTASRCSSWGLTLLFSRISCRTISSTKFVRCRRGGFAARGPVSPLKTAFSTTGAVRPGR